MDTLITQLRIVFGGFVCGAGFMMAAIALSRVF